MTSNRGKRWAYLGAIVGGAVSVLANIAHSFVPPNPEPAKWSPHGGAIALAAFWPLALLLAIEVLARVDWPRQLRWTLVRWGGVSPVALVAAVVSYRHLSGLLRYYGEDPITVTIGPAAVDGLMVVSTGALLALAALSAPIARSITDPIEDPIAEPSEEPSAQPLQSVGLDRFRPDGSDDPPVQPTEEPIGSDESDGSDRVVALHSVGGRVDERVDGSAPVGARPKDLAAAQEAIRAGRLRHPLTADAIRDELKIGLANARLVRDALPKQQAEA